MAKEPKYEAIYAEALNTLGDPDPSILKALQSLPPNQVILDLGAGQGRDAVPAAELGHRVIAVDIAKTGLRQLDELARARNLNIETVLCDVATYEPQEGFDVLLADRTFHMLKAGPREAALMNLLGHARANARIIISDEAGNLAALRKVVQEDNATWKETYLTRTHSYWEKD